MKKEKSDKTIKEYGKRAEFFYREWMSGFEITPANLVKRLEAYSATVTRGTWRFMRTALIHDQFQKNFYKAARKLELMEYPLAMNACIESDRVLWKESPNGKPKKGRGYCKKINQKDARMLLMAAKQKVRKKDGTIRMTSLETHAALIVCKLTGCRPIELMGIRDMGEGSFFIKGAKKDDVMLPGENGKVFSTRGLDRLITVDEKKKENMQRAVKVLNKMAQNGNSIEKNTKLLEDRVYELSKKVFFRRKLRPTLYTFRNQLASELKKLHRDSPDRMTEKQMSFLMGHQSTFSISKYGSASFASGGIFITPAIPEHEINNIVRVATYRFPRPTNSFSPTLR
ncbi:hypothetical protein [Methylophaga sp. OBS3]|uniref:hypothetical protein n=1 Tax=Methylophaga sp. OBS3 TaxID=2991934 RepID=UPI0022561030|nr:hypothetical protein [Methylophaga sp. OBS3]MCX4190283.1 hypothetical protein [Methylophaga sp. OBS3]